MKKYKYWAAPAFVILGLLFIRSLKLDPMHFTGIFSNDTYMLVSALIGFSLTSVFFKFLYKDNFWLIRTEPWYSKILIAVIFIGLFTAGFVIVAGICIAIGFMLLILISAVSPLLGVLYIIVGVMFIRHRVKNKKVVVKANNEDSEEQRVREETLREHGAYTK